jgi:hypothetical protein
MKSSALVVGILTCLLASAVAALMASNSSAAEPVLKWRTLPFLDDAKSSTNCGHQFQEPIGIEFDGKILKTGAWSRMTYEMQLLEPLNADGSGEVNALSMPANRSVIVKFVAGHGPRTFWYWIRYNARCFWRFEPVEG